MGIFDFFKKKNGKDNMEPIDGIPPSTWLPTPPIVNDYDRSRPSQDKQTSSKKTQNYADDDFNPLDFNSLIAWYKRQNPDATEDDIICFVKKLAAPDEDQEHLTAEGDLPWGWYTVHKEDTQRIEGKYKKHWKKWFDSRSQSPNENLIALESFVKCMIEVKELCENKGECFNYWRKILFTDEYLKKLSDELDNMKQNIVDLQATYDSKQEFERAVLPTLENSLMQIIRTTPGILQKELYKMFAPEAKSYIQEKLYYAEKSNKIMREKSGSSYKLYVK